jgi:hypothetical protein
MTFLAEVDYAFNERPKSVLEQLAVRRTSSMQELNSSQQESDSEAVAAERLDTLDVIGRTTSLLAGNNQHIRSHSYDVDFSHSTRIRVQGLEAKRKDRR